MIMSAKKRVPAPPPLRSDRRRMIHPLRRKQVLSVALIGLLAFTARAADKPGPPPSGPQTDGAFRKVVLEADRDLDGDGKPDDVVVDPMEIAVAPDGRVFFIERAGIVRCWDPRTKATTVAAKLPVFTGLEDGLIGLALDPKFAVNYWVYLFYSEAETHLDPQKGGKVADWGFLCDKIAAGADFVITQLFFDNEDFFRFQEFLTKRGVKVPIMPGILPVSSAKQTKKFTEMCGAKLPAPFLKRLDEIGDDDVAATQFGIEYATEQCRGLLKAGVTGLHFYTLNKAAATTAIVRNLGLAV